MDQTKASTTGAGAITIIALCCLVSAFEGIDLQAPGLTVPVLGPLFKMTPGDKGIFLSISTFGLILGATLGGRLSDLIGRKWVLIGSVTVFGLLTSVTAFSSSLTMLLIARFLTGVGLGGALPNVIAMVSESVTFERRSTAVGFLYASLPTGGAVASLVTALASGREQWPIVYLVGGIAPLFVAPLLAVVLPNRTPAGPVTGAPRTASIVVALFGERRAVRTVILWVGFFLGLLTLYLLLGWLPSLMGARGLTRPQASTVQMAFNAFGALGSVVTGLIMDRGRRGVVVGLVFASAMAAIAYLAAMPPVFALAVLGGGLVGATVSGTQTVLYGLAPSCYPFAVRGTGVGIAVAVGRLGSAAGPILAGVLIGSGRAASDVLFGLLPILALSGIAAIAVAGSATARN